MFRQNAATAMKQLQTMESTATTESEANLVGLDAKIPGGKYDSEIQKWTAGKLCRRVFVQF